MVHLIAKHRISSWLTHNQFNDIQPILGPTVALPGLKCIETVLYYCIINQHFIAAELEFHFLATTEIAIFY